MRTVLAMQLADAANGQSRMYKELGQRRAEVERERRAKEKAEKMHTALNAPATDL